MSQTTVRIDADVLQALAFEILDDDGQAHVAGLIEVGSLVRAQAYLFAAAEELLQQGELVGDELADVRRRIGLSCQDSNRTRLQRSVSMP